MLVAVVGPTATGKSALGLRLAEAFGGEIVSCDSTAVYRGIDIGTDKVPVGRAARHSASSDRRRRSRPRRTRRRGTRADAARGDARHRRARPRCRSSSAARASTIARSCAGCFPGPARDDALRARLDASPAARGVESLHRWLTRVDPRVGAPHPAARSEAAGARARGLPADRPAADRSFRARRRRRLPDYDVLTIGLDAAARRRCASASRARVDAQFARGVVAEVRALIAAGVPATAHAFSGLVYRQVVEMLQRRARRGRHARADRPREHALRAAAVDLVPQGAGRTLARRRRASRRPSQASMARSARRTLVPRAVSSSPLMPPDPASFSSSWTRSASASCPTRPRTATRAATRSATSRARCRLRVPTLRSLGPGARGGHRRAGAAAARRVRPHGGGVAGQGLGHRPLGDDGHRARPAVSDVPARVSRRRSFASSSGASAARTLGNIVASGTAIIDALGPEHMRTGAPIVYTSADSVFQIAAHEDVIPIDELYRICDVAFDLVGARPGRRPRDRASVRRRARALHAHVQPAGLRARAVRRRRCSIGSTPPDSRSSASARSRISSPAAA